MRPCKREFRLGVSRKTISGRREGNLRVTRFAAIRVSRSSELSGVHVHVALCASRGVQLVFRIPPRRFMALSALHRGVLAFQRETALLVLFARVQRRLEAGFGVAGDAIAPGRPARELAFVHVLMAIGAFVVCDRLLEIGILVTHEAAGLGVFSVERELGQVVVKSGLGAHRFPGGRDVAGLARALERRIHERAAVRVDVAVLTAGKGQSLVPGRSTPRRWRMALHTIQALMASGQGIRCAAVIEARCRLPGVLGMAVGTLIAELRPMRILMAGRRIPWAVREMCCEDP